MSQKNFLEVNYYLISVVAIGAGFAFWLTMSYANGLSNTEKISTLDKRIEKFDDRFTDVVERLTRIEGKIDNGSTKTKRATDEARGP